MFCYNFYRISPLGRFGLYMSPPYAIFFKAWSGRHYHDNKSVNKKSRGKQTTWFYFQVINLHFGFTTTKEIQKKTFQKLQKAAVRSSHRLLRCQIVLTKICHSYYCHTPPLKVGACPRSDTMETEKAIFHLLPRQSSWNCSPWIWLGDNWVLALKVHY